MQRLHLGLLLLGSLVACGGGSDEQRPTDLHLSSDGGDAGGGPSEEGGEGADGGEEQAAPDAGYDPARFVTRVVSFTKGPGGGFGEAKLPTVVEGPPHGGGACKGSLDVLALGDHGEIIVELGTAIVDGPGADFIVFENPFFAGCNDDPSRIFAELGEVSVSDDLSTWVTFPCTAAAYPYGACAGWHPVYSSADNDISPLDPEVAGGDAYDLSDVGLPRARYVRIRDMGANQGAPPTVGFDLDALAVVNAE